MDILDRVGVLERVAERMAAEGLALDMSAVGTARLAYLAAEAASDAWVDVHTLADMRDGAPALPEYMAHLAARSRAETSLRAAIRFCGREAHRLVLEVSPTTEAPLQDLIRPRWGSLTRLLDQDGWDGALRPGPIAAYRAPAGPNCS